MAEDKDLANQAKQSVKDIKSEAKTGIGFVKDAVKEAKAEIKQAGKEQVSTIKDTGKQQVSTIKDTVKQEIKDGIDKIKETAKDGVSDVKDLTKKSKSDVNELANKVKKEAKQAAIDIKDQTVDAVETVSKHTEKQVDSLKETASIISDKNKEDLKEATEESKEKILTAFDEGSKEAKSTIEKLIEQQKKKVDGTSESKKMGGTSTDLTTQILQNILSEIKILRKVTEGSVSFDKKSGRYRDTKGRYTKESNVREDATKEQDERDKKRKGFFSDLKNKFVKNKKVEGVKQSAKDIGTGISNLATNPLVLAGLLALLAPKELLQFLKGFLGEILFGENANPFVTAFGGLVAIWAGFKITNAFKSIFSVIKGLWNIGRFLYLNPIMLGVLALGISMYGVFKGMEKRARLQELREKKKAGTLDEKETVELAKLEVAEGSFETMSDPAAAATNIAYYQVQKEKQSRGEPYDKKFVKKFEEPGTEDPATVAAYVGKSVQDLKPEDYFMFNLDALKMKAFSRKKTKHDPSKNQAAYLTFMQDVEKEKQKFQAPVAESKPLPVQTKEADAAKTNDGTAETKPTTATPATSTAPSANPAPSGSMESSVPASPADNEQSKKDEEIPSLEAPQPSIGASINDTSEAIEAGYEDTAQDTISISSGDTTSISKPANVIDAIPTIYADRRSITMYEVFATLQ